MTEMRRVTISIPEDMDKRILNLRKREEFARCSYSEIIRRMVELGMGGESNVTPKQPNA